MVKAVVLYGPPEGPDAFERYYADTHTGSQRRSPAYSASKRREASRRRTGAPFRISALPSGAKHVPALAEGRTKAYELE